MFETWITVKIDTVIPRSIMLESDIKIAMSQCRTNEQFREKIVRFLKSAPDTFFKLCVQEAEFKCLATMSDDPLEKKGGD